MSNIGEIHPPTSGFKRFIIYREPYEMEDMWLVFPEREETYRVNLKFLRQWMLPLFDNDEHFLNTALDHFWNFYHCEFEPGIYRVNTLPLSAAYSYNLGGDGLDIVTKLANRVRKTLW